MAIVHLSVFHIIMAYTTVSRSPALYLSEYSLETRTGCRLCFCSFLILYSLVLRYICGPLIPILVTRFIIVSSSLIHKSSVLCSIDSIVICLLAVYVCCANWVISFAQLTRAIPYLARITETASSDRSQTRFFSLTNLDSDFKVQVGYVVLLTRILRGAFVHNNFLKFTLYASLDRRATSCELYSQALC